MSRGKEKVKTIVGSVKASEVKIAVIVSRFNEEITKSLLDGAIAQAKERGMTDSNLTLAWVPGAVEIPVVAQRLAQLGTFDAIVCLGAVIRGETDHYQWVCSQVSEGCQHVALQNDLPVIFGVLTTDTEEQAKDRIGGRHGHKGKDAIDAALETIGVLRAIG